MSDLFKEKEEVAAIMRRLYKQGLTTASGGNVSFRIDDVVLITASQIDKASIGADQIAAVDLFGNSIGDGLKTSMETGMHLAIYNKRPDISAIVHAHPVMATSFAIAHKNIKTSLAGESRAILGEPSLAPYALMGTAELAEKVAAACKKSNAVLMENHGVITLGTNLFLAYDRMEVLEACAKMTLITDLLGDPHELNREQLREIDKLFE